MRGVSGGGWKGEAVRCGVNASDEEDRDHGMTEGISLVGSGSAMRR